MQRSIRPGRTAPTFAPFVTPLVAAILMVVVLMMVDPNNFQATAGSGGAHPSQHQQPLASAAKSSQSTSSRQRGTARTEASQVFRKLDTEPEADTDNPTRGALTEVLGDLLGTYIDGHENADEQEQTFMKSLTLTAMLHAAQSQAQQGTQPSPLPLPAWMANRLQQQRQQQQQQQGRQQRKEQRKPKPKQKQKQKQQEQWQVEQQLKPQQDGIVHLQRSRFLQDQQTTVVARPAINAFKMHQEQQQLPKLTILLLSTFKDIARAMMSISSIKLHLAPELVREGILLTPWQEFLALRHAIAPTLGGRPCHPACYVGSSKVSQALQSVGLLSTLPDPTPINADAGVESEGRSTYIGCNDCGPPLWVVPEHLALGIEREEMAKVAIYNYRLQMILKLTVSALVSSTHYLVLDSDVLMIRRVGPEQAHWLFPEPGKALYQPQRRHIHRHWWNSTEAVLGMAGCLSTQPDTRVFGVTPAILATDIAATAARYWDMRLGNGSRLLALQEMLPRQKPFLTEYCSYHLVAECHMGNGTISNYHALRKHSSSSSSGGNGGGDGGGNSGDGGDGGGNSGQRIEAPALYRGLWRNGTWMQPGQRATACTDCLFLVVQSNSGVPERKVAGDLEELFT